MIKDITVYLDGTDADEVRIQNAVSLCERFDAHLTGLYINVMPQTIIGNADVAFPVAIATKMENEAIRIGDQRETALAARVDTTSTLNELRRYDIFRHQIAEVIATRTRANDLLVMTQPYGEAAPDADPVVMEAVLFGSGRGVFVIPPASVPKLTYRKVLLGWRNTREAARAVAEAMPFLSAAEQVVLAMVDEDGAPAQQGVEPAADIARHLDRHGVPVEVRHLSKWDRTADGLLNEAKAIDADLIVVGAYGHSRLREWALGGTTRDLLSSSTLPLLMAH